MAKSEGMSAAEALERVAMIEHTLDAWEETAPGAVQTFGGRDALARASDMTCIGPVPRLDKAAWEVASMEYQRRRESQERLNRGR